MIENQVILKVKKEHRDYIFLLASDSPLGEVFDVLTEMRTEIVKRIQVASEDPKPCQKESCNEEGNG